MSDNAPERIWAATSDRHGLRSTDKKPVDAVIEACGYVEYLRRDLAAPKVRPLEFGEGRNGYWNAGFGYQVAHTKGDLWRVRLNGKVICKVIKGFSRAVDWAQDYHRLTILSALEGE